MAFDKNTIDYLLKIPILIEGSYIPGKYFRLFCGKVDICGHLVMHYTVVMDHLSLLKVY